MNGRTIDPSEKAHPLAIIAAELVRESYEHRPGTWDFHKAFKDYLELWEWNIRSSENEISQSAKSADYGKQLFLFHRGLEIQQRREDAKKKLPPEFCE